MEIHPHQSVGTAIKFAFVRRAQMELWRFELSYVPTIAQQATLGWRVRDVARKYLLRDEISAPPRFASDREAVWLGHSLLNLWSHGRKNRSRKPILGTACFNPVSFRHVQIL